MIEWLEQNNWIFYLFPVIGLVGMWLFTRKLSAIRFAEYFVEKGQHEIASNSFIDEVRQESMKSGVNDFFEEEYTILVSEHGRNITNGQIVLAYEKSLNKSGQKSLFE